MQPYVESFINPINDSIIATHNEVACIDCHSGTTYKNMLDAQLTVAKKIGLTIFMNNLSYVDMALLSVNCLDCHIPLVDIIAHKGNTSCNNCHMAHQPSGLPLPSDFNELECSKCHELPTLGGKHAGIDCRGCHITHKYKPNCTQCHPLHSKTGTSSEDLENMAGDWTNDVCLGCHRDYHSPSAELSFKLSPNMGKELCAGCHQEYDILNNYGSRHNYLISCALCHEYHGSISVRNCNTLYCHGVGFNYSNKESYRYESKSDIIYDRSGICRTCHGQKALEPHYYAEAHVICTDCHGPSHTTAHAQRSACVDCHGLFESCRDCHQANIHKLKA